MLVSILYSFLYLGEENIECKVFDSNLKVWKSTKYYIGRWYDKKMFKLIFQLLENMSFIDTKIHGEKHFILDFEISKLRCDR